MKFVIYSFLIVGFLALGASAALGHNETMAVAAEAKKELDAAGLETSAPADKQSKTDAKADDDPLLLPGHPFYFFKQARERFEGWFAFNDVKKTLFFLKQAERRLNESRALLDRGKEELAEKNLNKYGDALQKAIAKSSEVEARGGKDAQEVAEKVSEAALKHQSVLLSVYERVAESARPAIEKAMEASNRGYDQTLKVFSEEKRNNFLNKEAAAREKIRGQIKSIQENFDVKLPQVNY